MVDMGEQMPAYNTHVPGSVMHWHARPTHVHGQRMKSDLKAFTKGDYQKLLGAGRENIRFEPRVGKFAANRGRYDSKSMHRVVSSMHPSRLNGPPGPQRGGTQRSARKARTSATTQNTMADARQPCTTPAGKRASASVTPPVPHMCTVASMVARRSNSITASGTGETQ